MQNEAVSSLNLRAQAEGLRVLGPGTCGGAYPYFSEQDIEPHQMAYISPFASPLRVIERASCVASRIAGTERSRGYCLELVCADFLVGRTEESAPEEIPLLIHRLVGLLPPDYQARLGTPRCRV